MAGENIILLAAGNNKLSEKPCVLWSLANGRSILDWQMNAFEMALPNSEVNIAVGYNYQKIINTLPSNESSFFNTTATAAT